MAEQRAHPAQWGLFLEDGGKSVREFCKSSGEDVNVLIEWTLSSPFMKHLTIEELWAVSLAAVI